MPGSKSSETERLRSRFNQRHPPRSLQGPSPSGAITMSHRSRRPVFQPVYQDDHPYDIYPRDAYFSPVIPVPVFADGRSPQFYTYGMPKAAVPAPMTPTRVPARPMTMAADLGYFEPALASDPTKANGDEEIHLRTALSEFHQETGNALDYFIKQIDDFEAKMQSVQKFSDNETQQRIWARRVAGENLGLWDSFERSIAGKGARVKTEVDIADFGQDNFLEDRFRNLSESLAKCARNITELSRRAKRKTTDCEKLISMLERAQGLSDPDTKRMGSWLQRVRNGGPQPIGQDIGEGNNDPEVTSWSNDNSNDNNGNNDNDNGFGNGGWPIDASNDN